MPLLSVYLLFSFSLSLFSFSLVFFSLCLSRFLVLLLQKYSTYFYEHFPKAIDTARKLRAEGGPARYVLTEFSWLILEYLDGAAGCTPELRNDSMIALLEEAIKVNLM